MPICPNHILSDLVLNLAPFVDNLHDLSLLGYNIIWLGGAPGDHERCTAQGRAILLELKNLDFDALGFHNFTDLFTYLFAHLLLDDHNLRHAYLFDTELDLAHLLPDVAVPDKHLDLLAYLTDNYLLVHTDLLGYFEWNQLALKRADIFTLLEGARRNEVNLFDDETAIRVLKAAFLGLCIAHRRRLRGESG